MRRWLQIVLLCALALSWVGCYYDVEEELYPNGCNTTDISYTQNIVPIIEANCLTCHDILSQNGNVVLDGYENVKQYADSGELLGTIRHEPGFSAMPQGTSKLPKCSIDRIQAWVDAGAPNN
ncbi:MAG: hypothetical protein R3330_10320 [Saprospiraceae bacterium]|nr:hypothetical protein [Saprospiraceae bacterium]